MSAAKRTTIDGVWERIRGGRHAALVGMETPAIPADLRAIRVRCDAPPSTFGPLLEARRGIEEVLGDEVPLVAQARDRVFTGLRRHLFGDLPQTGADAVLVEVANRLAQHSEHPAVLVFEAVEEADEATLASLRELVLRPHWLRLPMLLIFRTRAPAGLAGGLLDALLRVEGYTAAVQVGDEAPRRGREGGGFERLPAEVRAVLRAGALVGKGFEVALVARLLEVSAVEVLLRLQVARDFGVALEDPGDGRIYLGLDADARAGLLAGLLPSLANLWHRRIAELVSEAGAGEEAAIDEEEVAEVAAPEERAADAEVAAAPAGGATVEATDPPESAVTAEAEATEATQTAPDGAALAGVVDRAAQERAAEALAGSRPPVHEAPRDDGAAPRDTVVTPQREVDHAWRPAADTLDMSYRSDDEALAEAEADAPTRAAARPRPRSAPHVSRRHRRPRAAAASPGDAARAASHLSAAGDREAAAERYLAAAQEAAGQLADSQALAHAREALALLDALPASAKRRRLRVAALVEVAQVEWRSAGSRRGRTLEAAMATAEAARDALTGDDPAELRAQVALTIAGIGYDRGDLRSLEQALAALTAAARSLMAAGDPLGAASLLNDQAAIFIRLGDPVRALHLLDESRKVFEARGEDEPLAMVELAETHHLYARVPLHAAVQPGRERDAILMGLDHALIAEKLYRKADEPRELGRVWETMGRLELARGKRERAAQRLTAALEIQQRIGDAIGLARTSAALADLLAADGQIEESLRLLAASIALNRAKGSHVGLAFNRQTLARLGPKNGAPGQGLAAVIERELAAAEKLLGSRPLPPGLEVGTAG